MIAALVSRIVILPTGLIARTALDERLLACAVALIAYYATRRNLFAGVIVGVAVIVAFGYARGL
jgi:branched-subunit amino acid transport protein